MSKTIKVSKVKELTNELLRRDLNDDVRSGVIALAEKILFETDNYGGWNYVDWLEGGFQKWLEDGEPDFPEKNKYLGSQFKRLYY